MKSIARFVPVFAVLAVGCGDPDGLRAEGSVTLTVHQPGQPDGAAAITLPTDTLIDAPPGVGRGFFGSCTRNGTRWTIELSRADSDLTGLRRVALSVSEGAATTPATATFILGSTTYSASAECTATATSGVDNGVVVAATCTNLRAAGDPRTVDADVALTLTHCTTR